MDNAEKQVACVYLISLWIDMKRSETTLTSQEYKNTLFNIEENISLNLGISLAETKIMLDHKIFCQKQHEKYPMPRMDRSNEKIKNETERIKENLGVFNQTIVRINRASLTLADISDTILFVLLLLFVAESRIKMEDLSTWSDDHLIQLHTDMDAVNKDLFKISGNFYQKQESIHILIEQKLDIMCADTLAILNGKRLKEENERSFFYEQGKGLMR